MPQSFRCRCRASAISPRLPFLTKAADTRERRCTEIRGRRHPQALQHGRLERRAARLLHRAATAISHDVAAKWRATRWWGVDIGDPEIVVWGSPIELGAQDRLRRVRDRLLRTRLLPAFEMSEAKLDRFVAEIRRTRPRMLFGYPSALAHIAATPSVGDSGSTTSASRSRS